MVSRTAVRLCVAQVPHGEVDDHVAGTSSMVEIMGNFNISTLTAPAGTYFELSLDSVDTHVWYRLTCMV